MIHPAPPRPVTASQARRCENARTRRCACRCLGRFHGKERSDLVEYFEMLPQTDPHYIKPRSRQLPLPPPVGVPR